MFFTFVYFVCLPVQWATRKYVPIYGDEILKSELPMSAQLVGETVFVGYHMPVTDELETNAFREPVPVYKDNTDINMLYVGNNNMIYVPLE